MVPLTTDFEILDGHHRWLAAKIENRPIEAWVLDSTIPLIEKGWEFLGEDQMFKRYTEAKGSYPFAEKEAYYAGLSDMELMYARADAHKAATYGLPEDSGYWLDDGSTIAKEMMKRGLPMPNWMYESSLHEGRVTTEIKSRISQELGIPKSALSVTEGGGSMSRSYRIKVDLDYGHLAWKIEDIAKEWSNVHWDEHTGEILGGGNTFVSVVVDDSPAINMWASEIESAVSSNPEFNFQFGDYLTLDGWQISSQNHEPKKLWAYNFTHQFGVGSNYPTYTIRDVAVCIVHAIRSGGNSSWDRKLFPSIYPNGSATLHMATREPETNQQQDYMAWLGEGHNKLRIKRFLQGNKW